MKFFLACLCAALLLAASGPAARACKYCMIAAEEAESTRLSAQVSGQDFPLEGITNKYPTTVPSAMLATPPPATSVATKAADLPTTISRHAVLPPVLAAATVKQAPASTPVAAAAKPVATAPPSRWADAGLLGLATAGGVFCWRTRRATGSLS